MSNHNGHGPNPYDAITARIVAGAMEADKLPPAAAKAVRRALNMADARPPVNAAVDPAEEEKNRRARAMVDAVANGPSPAMVDVERLGQSLGDRVAGHQRALVNGLLMERQIEDPGDRLEGFDYPPTETAPGYREYELDGEPLIRFYSPEVAFDGDDMLVNLRYRVAT